MVIVLVVAIVLLFFLRLKIARVILRLFLLWGGSQNQAIWFYSVLTLPGVLVHEISHFFMAAFVGFRTGKIEMLPLLQPDGGIELGSVQVESGDPVRHSLVGLAPLVTGPILVTWLSSMVDYSWNLTWKNIGLLYLMTSIGLHFFPSKRDMRTWPIVAIFAGILGALLWYSKISLPSVQVIHQMTIGFGMSAAVALGLFLTLIVISIVQLRYTLWKNNHS